MPYKRIDRPGGNELRDMVASGMSRAAIGRHYGVDTRTIKKWLDWYNIRAEWRRGTRHRCNKLTAEDVGLIWQLRGHMGVSEVGRKFEVKPATIGAIWSGRSWAWLTCKLK